MEVHFLWRPQLSDPADEPVLEAAVNGQAAILVTYNVRDFQAAAVAEKVGVLRTAGIFLRQRAGAAKPSDLARYLRKAPRVPAPPGDEL